MFAEHQCTERALRVACAQGISKETSSGEFCHNAKSLAYVKGASHYNFKILYVKSMLPNCVLRTDVLLRLDQDEALMKLPQYLKNHKKDDLMDLRKSPYAYVKNLEGKTYYEVISADPERLEMFNQTLAHMDDSLPVLGMFPFALLKDQVEAEPNRPFLVDIGAGIGKVITSVSLEQDLCCSS